MTINPDSVFEVTKENPSPIGDTWFHEFEHNIDHRLSSSGLTYSFEYQHGAFVTSLMDEASARVSETRERYADIVSSAIKNKDADMLFAMTDNGVITYADYTGALKGTISDERIGELCKPSLPKARKLVAAQLSALPRDTTIAAFDIMNGATLDKVRDGWFHPDIGYWDPSGRHLATEAFAGMFAAHISAPQTWGTAVDYFPESCAMFETMLREALGWMMKTLPTGTSGCAASTKTSSANRLLTWWCCRHIRMRRVI